MNTTKQEIHRPGTLKQSNKQHKTGRHRSKNAVNKELKGKQNVIKTPSRRFQKILQKDARRNQLLQIRKKKREEMLKQKRNVGSFSAPILICIIPLQNDTDVQNIMSVVTSMGEIANIATSPCGVTHIGVPRLKQRFSIIIPPVGNVLATLDAAKVATTILFVISATSQTNDGTENKIIDDWGKEIIVSCIAQGLPAIIFAVHNIQKFHVKKRQEYKQSVQCAISKWFSKEKMFELDTPADCLNVLRYAGSQKQRSVFYKDIRPYLLAEELSFECNKDSLEFGTLTVTGYLRGKTSLSVDGLVHVSDFGDFQMSCIEAPEDPYPIEYIKGKDHLSDNEIKTEQRNIVLKTADPMKQKNFTSIWSPETNEIDEIRSVEDELVGTIETTNRNRKIVKIVPKGTSEYQATWIPDEDGESFDTCSENESEDNMSVEEARSEVDSSKDFEGDEYETVTISEAAVDEERYDRDIDMLEEEQAMERFKEAKLDAQFPDEVDTPQNVLAKTRFHKYRGLESFRTSPWDPNENLPFDYSQIFTFADYDQERKRIYKKCKHIENDVMLGRYITLHIINVSREIFKTFATIENRPLIVTALLDNEHQMSLLNVVLKHSNNYMQPIKSKERLIFQCGFRRFTACPIFSQHTNGFKHKYERYFHLDSTIVASMYAPITISPCPVLCYVENKGKLKLIATGSVLSSNPNRIILKRVVLSGHPYKVNKRSVVVRFMFFHREDIEWFKPIQLRTKYGRRGHIKEPLGTHGHMKCIFNGQLKSQDTVLMNLYKRVFPKWTYEFLQLTQSSCQSEIMQIE